MNSLSFQFFEKAWLFQAAAIERAKGEAPRQAETQEHLETHTVPAAQVLCLKQLHGGAKICNQEGLEGTGRLGVKRGSELTECWRQNQRPVLQLHVLWHTVSFFAASNHVFWITSLTLASTFMH